jgi:hypothetical protein
MSVEWAWVLELPDFFQRPDYITIDGDGRAFMACNGAPTGSQR